MSKNYFIKGAACTYYTIKEFSKHAPELQLQPLMLTRFMFLVENESKTDRKYSMYRLGANIIGKIQYNGGQHAKTEKGTEKAKACCSSV